MTVAAGVVPDSGEAEASLRDVLAAALDSNRELARLAAELRDAAGIGQDTGQLTAGQDGGPRRLVISSDFCAVYQSAGKKAGGLVNLSCRAHARRHLVRAGDANPVRLKYWTDARLERIRNLYAARDELNAAWQDAAAPAVRGNCRRGPAGEGIRRLG